MTLALLLALCSDLAAADKSGASADLIPLEDFTRNDAFGTIRVSPDGTTFAATGGRYGRSGLTFVDLRTRKVITFANAGSGNVIGEFHWVSNRRVLYTIRRSIYGIDKDGGRPERLYRSASETVWTSQRNADVVPYAVPELISTLRADDDHVLIAEFDLRARMHANYANWDAKPRLARLDVLTGHLEELGRAPLNAATVLVDRDDEVRFALGYDREARLALSWRARPGASWSDCELPGLRLETVRLLRFSPDNRFVYLAGARTGDPFAALYKLDPETRNLEKIAEIDGADVTDVVMDFVGREVVGVRGETDRIVYRWLNPEGPEALLYGELARAFANQQIEIVSVSGGGRRAIVLVSSDVNPGDFYLLDTGTKKAEFISASRSWIDTQRMRPRRAVEIKARDGLTLRAYVTAPAGEGSHPMVVLVRDHPYDTRESWRFDWEAQLLASRGFAVLQVNFRGTPGFGPGFKTAGYREWGRAMQDDLTDAARWAIEQKIVAADRICIMGVGYGGYAALMGAVREPGLYRCAIGYGGIYDLEAYSRYQDVHHPLSWPPLVEQILGSDVAELQARSPLNNVDKIDIPVFLLHAKGDAALDHVPARHLRWALSKRGTRVEWMDLGYERNPVDDEDMRRKVAERILAFLDDNLQ